MVNREGFQRKIRWNKCRKALSGLMTVALFIGGFVYCDKLLTNKQSIQKYGQFFESDKTFDVLFVGSSHVVNGISPLDLFRDYGISSFNLAMHGNYVKSGYYLLKSTLERMERGGRDLPEMVVLDVYGDWEDIGNLHTAWDSFPFNQTKNEMARELTSQEDYMGMVMPFSLYHSRWSELENNDFSPNRNQFYGVELRYGISYPDSEIVTDSNDRKEISEEKLFFMDRIKNLCDSYGISLVLIHIPYSYYPDWQREANSFYEYAGEHELCFVNYMNEDLGIDFDIDFFDQGHMNPAGMRIMTKELGKLLQGMGMADQRQDSSAAEWQKNYEAFIDYRAKRLKSIDQAKIYLMSLQDPDFVSIIQVKRGMLEDVQTAKLIERLKDGENQVIVVDDKDVLPDPDSKEENYDLYCVVYKKTDLNTPVDSGGFVQEKSFSRKN